MLRAEQRQVFQETNVRLVELRHLEIDYYFTVNAAIGTQSVLIGGFAYGLFTKNTNNGTEYGRLSLAAFYVTSAITIFASIHVVVMSLLLQVFGPGLALHGPAGSMARAAEVMLDEQRQVMVGFITMMVFFALSTVMCFWTAMDFVSACICTGVFVVAVRQWLYYWRRVYFKLYWDKSRAKRMFEDVKAHSDEPFVRQTFSKYVNSNNVSTNKDAQPPQSMTTQDSEVSERPSLMDQTRQSIVNMFTRPSVTARPSMAANESTTNNPMMTSSTMTKVAIDPNSVVMEGYLTKKTLASRRSIMASSTSQWSQWERRYCVINGRGQLQSYKSRQEYRAGEPSSLKERPLELEDYWIYFDANIPSAEDSWDETKSVVSTATTATSSTKPTTAATSTPREMFRMTLVSKDTDVSRKFIFRCDTEEELEMWFDAIEQLLPENIATSNNADATPAEDPTLAAINPVIFDPNQHAQGLPSMPPAAAAAANGTSESASNSRRNSFRASFSLGSSKK